MVEQYSSFLDEKQRQRELLGGVASRQSMHVFAFVLVLSEAVIVLDRFFSSTSTIASD